MKKSLMFLLVGFMVLGTASCGATEQLVEECKDQYEWTKENDALTNGRSSSEQFADTVEDLTGVDISSVDEESSVATVSSSAQNEYAIGEVVPLTSKDIDGNTSKLDLVVTGYQPVYNGQKNVTAIFYTVTNKEGSELQFENTMFTCYADNKFVTAESWEDHTSYDYAILIPGTSYEGCYVADVDANLVNTIDLHAGNITWHVKEEEVPVESVSDYDFEKVIDASGFYSDGIDSLDISFYSSPDENTVGTFTASMNGMTYSGELEYDGAKDCYYCKTDNMITVSIVLSDYVMEVSVESKDGSVNYQSSTLIMIEQYES